MPNHPHFTSSERNVRLLGIFLLALLIFNYPLVRIFGRGQFLLGVPLIYAYFFIAWLMLIGLVFWTLRGK